MSLLFSVAGAIGIALQVALVFFLLPRGVRKFPILMLHAVARLLADAAEVTLSRKLGFGAALYAKVYWTSEVFIDMLLFLMVIVFTYQVLEGSPMRAQAARLLTGVGVVAVLAPFAIYHQRVLFSNNWFNGVIQWLNFGAGIMNLALWTALLANKKRDPQLVAVSIGLGLAVTGAALGFGFRQFFRQGGMRNAANLEQILTHLLGLTVWCWTFRPSWMREQPPRPPQTQPSRPSPAATSSGY